MQPIRERIPLARWSRSRVFERAVKRGFEASFHFHPEFEIVLLERSPAEVYLGKDMCSCREGDIVFVDSGMVHTFISDPLGRPAGATVVQFGRDALAGYDEPCWNPAARHDAAALVYHVSECPGAAASFAALPRNTRRGETPDEGFVIHGALCRILAQLGNVRPREIVRRPRHPAVRADGKNRVAEVLSFLHRRATGSVALADAAGVAGVSVEQFCRFFKRHTGRTFTEYVNTLRLSAAARALLETDKRVVDVAGDCGYENLSYFNRRFKRRYGMAPGEYRKKTTGGVYVR